MTRTADANAEPDRASDDEALAFLREAIAAGEYWYVAILKTMARWSQAEETLDGRKVYVLEAIPIDDETAKELGYGKVISWIDAEIWMARKSTFWDPRGTLLKTVVFEDIRQVQGIWTQHRIEVENHKTGHRTVFEFSDVDYESAVDDDLFTERALRRGR